MQQASEQHVHKHQLHQPKQQRALQRQHIEVTIVVLSGCRLCAALACSQSTGEPAGPRQVQGLLAAAAAQPPLVLVQATGWMLQLSPWCTYLHSCWSLELVG